MRAVGFGIDFGTTNSSIAVAYADRVDVIAVQPSGVIECLPSIVYLHRNGDRSAGMDAVEQYLVTGAYSTRCAACDLGPRITDCRQFRRGGGCNDARLMYGLKTDLSRPNFDVTHSWAIDFSLSTLVAVIFSHLKVAAEREARTKLSRAVIGYPVAFVGAEGPDFERRQTLALERLRTAAQLAGFDEIEMYPEPAAAVMNEVMDAGYLLSLDFGGGTFDAAVVEYRHGEAEIVALQGAAVGGAHFDELLFDAKVAPALGWDELPGWLLSEMRSLASVRWLLTDPEAAAALARINKDWARLIERIIFGGFAYGFYQAIEQAKIQMSTATSAAIRFYRPGIDINIAVTRDEFDRLIRSDLDVIEETVSAALEQAGIKSEQVTQVLRTGGSGTIPAFISRLHAQFGESKVAARPAFTSVVKGLGLRAQGLWA